MVIHTCLRPRRQSVFEFMWNSFLTDFEIKQFSLFEYLMDRHLSWEHCLSFRLYIAFAANFCTRSIFLWFLNQHYIYTDLTWTGLDRPRFVSSCYLRLLLKDMFCEQWKGKVYILMRRDFCENISLTFRLQAVYYQVYSNWILMQLKHT